MNLNMAYLCFGDFNTQEYHLRHLSHVIRKPVYAICKQQRRRSRMKELGFYVPSTVFQSFRQDGRVNMKDSVQ